MPDNQGTITYHGLVEINKHHDARIKVTVHNKSKDANLHIKDVVGYVQVGKHRLDQTVDCHKRVEPRKSIHLDLVVHLPEHVRGVSNARIGLIIPNCGHVTITGQT
ncbi:hypothetical protein LIER_37135 [Lithospermum erythrorhizon]|uniref:Uncharacterized protein n=1 Tax=Lithospermum erythrorhizon TaxID=34254 RepID=A0AAV3PFW8_LITER